MRIGLVIALLAAGARAGGFCDDLGHSIQHRADVDEIRSEIRSCSDLNAKDQYGETALGWAVRWNYLPAVRALVEAGADVNRHGFLDNTPLINAASEGNLPIVKALLEAGADVNVTGGGMSALERAKDKPAVEDALIDAGAQETVTVSDRAKEKIALRDVAVRARANPNGLFSATSTSYAQALLDRGADVNQVQLVRGKPFSTPLIAQALAGRADLVRFLLEHGASVNARVGEAGGTALFAAVRVNAADVIRELLGHGADTSLKNGAGKTALEVAEERRGQEMRTPGAQGHQERLAKMEAVSDVLKAAAPPANAATAPQPLKETAPVQPAARPVTAPAPAAAPAARPQAAARAPSPRARMAVFGIRDGALTRADRNAVDARGLASALRETALDQLPAVEMMASEKVTEILVNSGKDLEKCEGLCISELGRMVAADYAVGGRLYRSGRLIKVNLELWETRTSVQLAGATAQGEKPEELEDDLRRASVKLFEKFKAR